MAGKGEENLHVAHGNIENVNLADDIRNKKAQENPQAPANNNNNCCVIILFVITVVVLVIIILIESVVLAYMHATYNNRKEIEIELAEQKILAKAAVNATNLARCLQDLNAMEAKMNNTGGTYPQTDTEHVPTAIEQSFMKEYNHCIAKDTTDKIKVQKLRDSIRTLTEEKQQLNGKYKQCTENMKTLTKQQSEKRK